MQPMRPLDAGRPGAGGSRELLVLAVPVVISNASSTLMSLVDTAFVGHIGAAEVAAVGLSGIVIWTLFSFLNGTLSAVNTFVAQCFGAGRLSDCAAYTWNGLWLANSALLLIVLVLLLVDPLFAALTTPEVERAAVSYSRIRVFATAAFAFVMVFESHLRGCGDTRTPMWITIAANLVNVVATWALVYGRLGAPALGVEGAAIGTLLAQGGALAAHVALFLSRGSVQRFGTWPPSPVQGHLLRGLLRVGLPIGGTWILDMASFTVFNLYVGTMGTAALAVTTIVIQIQSVSFMQLNAVGHASSTLVGQYLGAGRPDLADRSGRSALRIGAIYGLLVGVVFLWLREDLVGFFNRDPLVLALGSSVILYSALMQLLDAPGIVIQGALRGAGDTRFPLLAGAFSAWGLMLPAAYLLGTVAELGIDGAWAGMVLWALALSLLLVTRFLRGAWQRKGRLI